MHIVPQNPSGGDMAGLMPVHQERGELWADARTLHATLQVGRDFSTWIQGRLDEIGATEGEEFIVLDGSPVSGKTPVGRQRRDYWLNLDLAKEIAMLERTETGREVRRYFIQAEKELRARPTFSLPDFTDPVISARAWADEVEGKRQALAQVAQMAPKAQAFDSLMSTDGTYSMNETAKIIGKKGLGQNQLFDLLRARGILYRNAEGSTVPYQQYVTRGYFTVRAGERPSKSQGTVNTSTTRVTVKGLAWICKNVLDLPVPQPRLAFGVSA